MRYKNVLGLVCYEMTKSTFDRYSTRHPLCQGTSIEPIFSIQQTLGSATHATSGCDDIKGTDVNEPTLGEKPNCIG